MQNPGFGRRFFRAFDIRAAFWSLLLCACGSHDLQGITIRHDVDDSQYRTLSAGRRFESAGAMSYFVNTNPTNVFWCNATVIHPEWALTAGHCTIASPSWEYTFYRGPDRINPTATIPVDTKLVNPAFNGNNFTAGSDFGLIRLTTPVLDATPARLYRGSQEFNADAFVVGYGRTGTGLTGENASLPNGIRRTMQNAVDGFGDLVGWSSKLMLTDFDNPTSSVGNQFGSGIPTPFEGNVALNDSGGGWFQRLAGVEYLTGVTSFRASTDGTDNSSYRDLSFGGRVSRDLTWIDANHDRTQFWVLANGNWGQTSGWDGAAVPTTGGAAVIRSGNVNVNASTTTEYVFLDDTGSLTLTNTLQTTYLRMRDTSRIAIGAPTGNATIGGTLRQDGGTLAFDVLGSASGQFDRLNVLGPATLNGTLEINLGATYAGPGRGSSETFALLDAPTLTAGPSAVQVRGRSTSLGTVTYVGETASGQDGLFARVIATGTELRVVTYLARPGDANGDGIVDGSDFGIWNSNKFTTGGDWSRGDFNEDGVVDGSDFGIWNSNKFTGSPWFTLEKSLLIPEPTLVGWCSAIGLVLAARRRRVVV